MPDPRTPIDADGPRRGEPVESFGARAVLTRMLRSGPLGNLPKDRRGYEIILALGACRFDPARTYSEVEVRERLEDWLARFIEPVGLDHATLRRLLVEAGFLHRDPAGSVYSVDHGPVAPILSGSERNLDPGDLLESLRAERERRKQEWKASRP